MMSNLAGSSLSSFSSIKGADAGRDRIVIWTRKSNFYLHWFNVLAWNPEDSTGCLGVNTVSLVFTNYNVMMQLQHVFLTYFEPGPKSNFCLRKKRGRKKPLLSRQVNWESQTAPGCVWEKPNAKISFSIVNVFTIANRTARAPIQKFFMSAFRKYLFMQRY